MQITPEVPQALRPRTQRTWLGKLLLSLSGVVLALLLTEAGLRRLALLMQHREAPSASSAHFRVLCVGDSFTFGLGSENHKGYPEHLQEMLESRLGEGASSVFNRGVPGYNSSMVADRLPAWIEETRPNLLILLVGHNNSWNYKDLHLEGLSGESSASLRFARGMGELRVVRLLQLAFRWELGETSARRSLSPAAESYFKWQKDKEKREKSSRERAEIESQLERVPNDLYALVKLAHIAESEGQLSESRSLMERAMALDPSRVVQIRESQKSIERWHEDQRRQGLGVPMQQAPSILAEVFAAMNLPEATSPEVLYSRQREILESVLRADLIAMTQLARSSGASVLFCGYASHSKTGGPILESVATELGAPFVDQERDFERRIMEGTPRAELFVLDGHCRSKGYRLMAENLLPIVMKSAIKGP